ncbi:MAG: glycosyltransferase [Clostridia bacterium]|nr:glycosyltransferase [Clostridia bacterium]
MKKIKDPRYVPANKSYYDSVLEKFKEFNSNGKKTVCYFCDTYYPILDGVIVTLNNYARLQSQNYNIVVCVPKHKGKVTISKDYLVLGVSSMFFKFVNYDLAFPDIDNDFKAIIKKLRIDIIHSHSPFNMGNFACKLAKKRKIPLVCTFHSQYKQDFYKATKNEALTHMLLDSIMKNFKPATEVWTMNDACVRTIREYGYKGKVHLIPNSTHKVRPENIDALIEQANEKWGLANVENVFIFVGRLVSQKNILLIPEALKILKERGVKFKMYYVGTGPDENKLRKLIEELELQDDIILLGRVEDAELEMIFARSTLMLFPSVYDTSSLTQIEAATFDTPCLLIKDSVTAGTITDNQNGFLALNDATNYAERIMEIIADKDLYEKVKSVVYEQLFVSHEDVAKMVAERYEYLMEHNDRRNEKIISLTKDGKEFEKKQEKIAKKYV